MVPLARRYLFSDRIRFAISAGGVTFAVLLIVMIQALYQGLSDQAGRIATAAPSDLWVMQAGTPDPSHGASILPNSVLSDLQEVPGVAAAQPLLGRTMQVGSEPFAFVMAVPEGPFQARTIKAFGPRSLPERGQIILSDLLGKEIGADRGDAVFIGASRFEVAEVSSLVEGFSGTAFVSAQDAAQLFADPKAFSFALVAVSPEADLEEVVAAIEDRVPGTNALTPQAFADVTRRELEEGFLPIVAVLIGIAFVVGLAVIALTIYTSTVERTRDYGVLKAVGASPGQLFAVVVRQSVVVALVGYALGSVLGLVAGRLIQDAVPEFALLYRWQDFLFVLAAALVMSAVAAIVPIRRVARIDPAVVFRA
jgi:putative ABC transport system permease protein